MPTYEYVCTSCENAWEEIQKISEPALDTCPKCHQQTAKRQISGGTFILKGGGWYADAYSSAKPSSKESSSGKSSDSGAKTTEAAPAAAPAPAAPAPAKESSGGSKDSGSTGSTGSTRAA